MSYCKSKQWKLLTAFGSVNILILASREIFRKNTNKKYDAKNFNIARARKSEFANEKLHKPSETTVFMNEGVKIA